MIEIRIMDHRICRAWPIFAVLPWEIVDGFYLAILPSIFPQPSIGKTQEFVATTRVNTFYYFEDMLSEAIHVHAQMDVARLSEDIILSTIWIFQVEATNYCI